jgi:hypothetical protein
MSAKAEIATVEQLGDDKSLVTVSVREVIPTAKYANIELFTSATRVTRNVTIEVKSLFEEIDEAQEPKRNEILRGMLV